jgi:DNA-binding NarL/FixJ family response regulator
MSGPPLRVLLIDDHALVRAALADTLRAASMEVVAAVGSGEEALGLVGLVDTPDIVLVDLDLPGMDGVQLVREMRPRLPGAAFVVLTGVHGEDQLVPAMRAGAAGYLRKDIEPDALVRALIGATRGDLAMTRELAARLVSQLLHGRREGEEAGGLEALSDREREVLTLLSQGRTDRQIAERLGISMRTVGHHVGHILRKLGAENRAEAALIYRRGSGDPSSVAAAPDP